MAWPWPGLGSKLGVKPGPGWGWGCRGGFRAGVHSPPPACRWQRQLPTAISLFKIASSALIMLEPEPRSGPISIPELVFSILLLILFVFGLVGKIRRVLGHFAPIFSLAPLPRWAAHFHSLVLLDPRAILILEPSLVSGFEPVVGTESRQFHLPRTRLVPEILDCGIRQHCSSVSWTFPTKRHTKRPAVSDVAPGWFER